MFYAKEINADIAKLAWHKAVNVSLFCYPTLRGWKYVSQSLDNNLMQEQVFPPVLSRDVGR